MTHSVEIVWDQDKKPIKPGLKRFLKKLGWYSMGLATTIFGLGLLLLSVVIVMGFSLLPSFKGSGKNKHL